MFITWKNILAYACKYSKFVWLLCRFVVHIFILKSSLAKVCCQTSALKFFWLSFVFVRLQNGPFPASFSVFSPFQQLTKTNLLFKKCWWLDPSPGPRVLETATLPTVPQANPHCCCCCCLVRVLLSLTKRSVRLAIQFFVSSVELATSSSSHPTSLNV